MANTAQAKKRARQAEIRRQRNVSLRSMLRTGIKKVVNAITAGDQEKTETAYKASVPTLDSMARRGLISKNKAARHKSRLNAHMRAL